MGYLELKAQGYESIPAAPDARVLPGTIGEGLTLGNPPCRGGEMFEGPVHPSKPVLHAAAMSGDDVPPENEGAICDAVVQDVLKRKALGLERYGKPLRFGDSDGRDMLQEAYEEALDLAIYLRKAQDEKRRLVQQVEAQQTVIQSMAARIEAQQFILSRTAEKAQQHPWLQQGGPRAYQGSQ